MKIINMLVAAVALAACTAASAAFVNVTWNTSGLVNAGTVYSPPTPAGQNIYAGRFTGTVTSTDLPGEPFVDSKNSLFAYCYDLAQTLATNSQYTVQFGANARVLDFLGAVNALLGGDPFAWLHPGSSSTAAAIQFGIWEALYDDDFAMGAGAVRTSRAGTAGFAGVESQFNAFVAAMAGNPSLSSSFVMVLSNERTQDVITGRLAQFVPEPGSLALLGLAAVAAAAVRRRRR